MNYEQLFNAKKNELIIFEDRSLENFMSTKNFDYDTIDTFKTINGTNVIKQDGRTEHRVEVFLNEVQDVELFKTLIPSRWLTEINFKKMKLK